MSNFMLSIAYEFHYITFSTLILLIFHSDNPHSNNEKCREHAKHLIKLLHSLSGVALSICLKPINENLLRAKLFTCALVETE